MDFPIFSIFEEIKIFPLVRKIHIHPEIMYCGHPSSHTKLSRRNEMFYVLRTPGEKDFRAYFW